MKAEQVTDAQLTKLMDAMKIAESLKHDSRVWPYADRSSEGLAELFDAIADVQAKAEIELPF